MYTITSLPLSKRKKAFALGLGYEMLYTLSFFSLQDMHSFINQKGPLTEGIFRKSAHINSYGIIKEKLNSGDRVNFDSESVLVVASVLKLGKVLALSTHEQLKV